MLAFDTKQPDSTTLHLHAKGLFLLAHKNNIHSVYNRAWSIFDKYYMFYDKRIYQLPEMDLIEFVAFMSQGGLALATIITYMSGVKHHLRVRGAKDFNDSFLLKFTLKGVTVSPHDPDVRLPITLLVLERILHALSWCMITSLKCSCILCYLLLGFMVFCRSCNFS